MAFRRITQRITLVDRYVLGGFGVALAGTLALMFVLYAVADAFQSLDRLVDHFRRESALLAFGVIVRYYAAKFLSDVASFGEVVALVPALVVVASMARGNEFVAPLAAGTSLRRLALPVLACSALVGLLAFLLACLAGPALVRRSLADRRRIEGTARSLGQSLSVQGRSGRAAVALSLERYDADAERGTGFRAAVIEPGRPFLDVRAPVAAWDRDAKRWRFPEGGVEWRYGADPPSAGGAAAARAFERVAGFDSALGPDLLEAEELGTKVLSLGSLLRQRARPEFASALHGRLAQLLAPLVVALASLPFLLTTERSRVFHGACLAILVAVSYEVAARAVSGYFPPLVGGWLAPVAFGGFGAWRLARVET